VSLVQVDAKLHVLGLYDRDLRECGVELFFLTPHALEQKETFVSVLSRRLELKDSGHCVQGSGIENERVDVPEVA
jgi:hypothetical protein